MFNILAVGVATLDIVNTVASYPDEDAEVRALEQSRLRGGNATNTLVILSQLGHACGWAGVLPQEPDAVLVEEDLRKYGVKLELVQRMPHGKLPTSYVFLSADTGSRTIVHYRELPEYDFSSFDQLQLEGYDWIHFEGRHVPALELMLNKARLKSIPCSLEVEKPREGIEALFGLPDVLLFSRGYVQYRGHQNVTEFLQAQRWSQPVFVAWGEAGAWCRTSEGTIFHQPAPRVSVVDSLGAGDVFNAGVIDGLLRRQPLK
ncbi:MAG TPA: ketohexokinase, partial [Thiolapillus brandeum]|nr:ketohexokinase [Thiolapillus brandeum]